MLTRRQRHLNPASCGAVIALDARFLTGFADGDAVETWTGRSGTSNNATQSSAGNRPTFKAAVLNGQATVRFGSNQYMEIASISSIVPSAATVVMAYYSPDASRFLLSTNIADSWDRYFGDGYSYPSVCHDSSGHKRQQQYDQVASSVTEIQSQVISSTFQLFRNGVASSLNANPYGFVDSVATLGRGSGGFNAALDFGACIVVPSAVSAAVRKRLEQSLAASFRIAAA